MVSLLDPSQNHIPECPNLDAKAAALGREGRRPEADTDAKHLIPTRVSQRLMWHDRH
jgi:hypothetical protein